MTSETARYLIIAEKLADDICQNALWYEDQCNWIGVFHHTQIANTDVVLRALPSNFYNGSAGVGFFLAAAFQQFQKPIYQKTAMGAFTKTKHQIHKIRAERIGFYEGLIGIAYSMMQAGEWLLDSNLVESGKQIVEKVIENDKLNWSLDIQEGCSGAVSALIVLQKKYSLASIEHFLNTIGNRLLTTANKTNKGWSWKTLNNDSPNMIGYAHGTAGIAHALIELYEFTKDEKYLNAVKQAIKYENQFFSPKYMNWKDLRITDQKRINQRHFAMSAWCVGAVGIGFSRLRVFQLTKEEGYFKDVLNALKNISEKILENSRNFSLCHGFFGNMALFLQTSLLLNEPAYKDIVYQKINEAFDKYQNFEKPLPDGGEFNLDNPTFMLGWSGIGYFLLRLVSPEQFPEVLLISDK